MSLEVKWEIDDFSENSYLLEDGLSFWPEGLYFNVVMLLSCNLDVFCRILLIF